MEKINNMKAPVRPSEQGDIQDNREFLIWLRDKALTSEHIEMAMALSHTIAWLYYLIQLEEYYQVSGRKM